MEKHMYCVQTKSIFEAWAQTVKICLMDGQRWHDDNVKIWETTGVAFSISNPRLDENMVRRHGSGAMIDAMIKNFTTHEPQFGFAFSYGSRIYEKDRNAGLASLISILRKKPEAKSATMSLLRSDDHLGKHVPCITTIDFKIRNGRLDTHYFARSQDAYKKNYADNLAILTVATQAAKELGVTVGSLSGYIASSHIYEADFAKAQELLDLDALPA
jgi:thymidylate synthase